MKVHNIRFYCEGKRMYNLQDDCPTIPQVFDILWLVGSSYLVDQVTRYPTGDVDVHVVPCNVYGDGYIPAGIHKQLLASQTECRELHNDLDKVVSMLNSVQGSYLRLQRNQCGMLNHITDKGQPEIDSLKSELSWVKSCACFFLFTSVILGVILLCML